MMLAAALAAALLTVSPQAAPQQTPPAQDPAPVALEDITVTGRPLETLIQTFVDEVAEPNRNRGLARWNGPICVGAANLRPELAQYLVDRISTVAEDLGLRPGAPGCNPNLLIIATDNGEATARALVRAGERELRMGGSGMDRGRAALVDFQETDRPIRWWQVSMPTDSESGSRAVRLPGDCIGIACTAIEGSVYAMAPVTYVSAASRLNSDLVDNIVRTVVIIDINDISGLSALQLSDYIAMVSLAQIDPSADTRRYASILNVLADSTVAEGLTGWDRSYLEGLYAAERNRVNVASDRTAIMRSIQRAHHRSRAEADVETPR